MKTNKYSFLGLGAEADGSFSETFESEKEAIEAAKNYYKSDVEYDEIFGWETDENGDLTENLCSLISVLKVKDFDYEEVLEGAADDVKDFIDEQYYDFESTVDDGDFRVKEGYKEAFVKALLPVIEEYGYVTGVQSIGYELYKYDVQKDKIITEE